MEKQKNILFFKTDNSDTEIAPCKWITKTGGASNQSIEHKEEKMEGGWKNCTTMRFKIRIICLALLGWSSQRGWDAV